MCNLSRVVMERGMEKGIEKGIQKGIQKGKAEAEKAMVTAMLREGGIPAEKISGFCSHLTLNDIKKLEAELSMPL